MPPGLPTRQKPPPTGLPVLVALLGGLVFAITLRGDFLYDDIPVLLEDPRVRNPSMLPLIWTQDYHFNPNTGDGAVDNLYRPLVTTSFLLQQAYLRHGAPGLRIVNLLLYALVCALVARLALRLAPPLPAALAAVLFAVHPVHTEVLATVVGRAELLAAVGILASLVLLTGKPLTHARAVAIAACGLLALLSKEQGLLLPALLLAAFPLRPRSEPDTTASPAITPPQTLTLLTCLLVAGYIVLREQILGLKFWWDRSFLDPAIQPMIWSTGPDRLLMPPLLLGQAVLLLLVPATLSLDYSGAAIGWTVSPTDPRLYVGLVAAAALAAGGLYAGLKRRWGLLFALAGFVLTWGVVGNAVSLIGVNFAERLLFLPSAFAALLLAVVLPRRAWACGLVAVVAIAFAAQSVRYAWHWSQPRPDVYAWTLERNPRSVRLHQLLADEQMRAGQLDAAADTIARGTRVLPNYFGVWVQAGVIAERRQRWDDAERFYATAAEIDPQRGSGALLDFRARRAANPP